jgi:hypothetical protein
LLDAFTGAEKGLTPTEATIATSSTIEIMRYRDFIMPPESFDFAIVYWYVSIPVVAIATYGSLKLPPKYVPVEAVFIVILWPCRRPARKRTAVVVGQWAGRATRTV